MIYFNETYITQAWQIIFHPAEEIKEFTDIKKDLDQIAQVEQNLFHGVGKDAAIQLDFELRKKYPIINHMLDIANNPSRKFLSLFHSNPTQTSSNELSYLQQDRCGILCHVLIKKEIVSRIEECILYVD